MDYIQGTCTFMCPVQETKLRLREKLIHPLEVLGQKKVLVKCYNRSAADTTMAIPSSLRTFSVLRQTVQYLMFEVTKRKDVSMPVMYDFINDRLRSVRQDITIQRLHPQECLVLLEPMVRFHVYFGYILCECPIKDFDPVLNEKYLLECLKLFLNYWDSKERTEALDVEDITRPLTNMTLSSNEPVCDNILMECLYIMCNLNDINPMWRYLKLPKEIQRATTLNTVFNIAIANMKGNFVRVFQLAENLCPLTYCAFCIHIPRLQRTALQVMSHAYNSRQLVMPHSVLKKLLWFDSDARVKQACEHYGLKMNENGVVFNKMDFKSEAKYLKPEKHLLRDKILNVPLETVFTYNLV